MENKKSQCQGCPDNPKVLACDATKVGIKVASSSISPVETFDEGPIQKTENVRFQRCFLTNNMAKTAIEAQEARQHLKWLCRGVLGKEREDISANEEATRTANLLSILPPPCHTIFQEMINDTLDHEKSIQAARFLYALGYDAPLRSFIPLTLISKVSNFIESPLRSMDEFRDLVIACNRESSLLGPFFEAFYTNGGLEKAAADFIRYLCCRVKTLHANDIKPAAANPIEGSYNPPKLGRGYSFRKDGKQIRVNRKFTKDNEKEKNGNNDAPESKCSKKFPK